MGDRFEIRVNGSRVDLYRPMMAGSEIYPMETMPHLWTRQASLTAVEANTLGEALKRAAVRAMHGTQGTALP